MFLQFKEEASNLLKAALEAASYDRGELTVDLEESEHADLASRIAFSLARSYRKPPAVIAAEIVAHATIPPSSLIREVVAVGPYINCFVNESFLAATLQYVETGTVPPDKNERIILEHTSANPDGPLHIGHLRNAVIGDTLVRVLRRAGYEVEPQYYLNDMGRQIAVVVWGAERMRYDETKKVDHAVADVYIAANRMLAEQSEYQEEVGALMRRYEAGDETVMRNYDAAVQKCLAGIQDSFSRLNIQPVTYKYESEFARSGAVRAVIEELKQKGEIKREGEAVLLQLAGIEKALVIQRSDGTSLYTTRDLAYHRWKGEHGDRVIDVFGKDHELVSQQLRKALELLGVKAPEFVIFAFVSLPSGSLSTRAGRYIAADDLMEQIEERSFEAVAKRRTDLSDQRKREIARMVGIGALRYDIVKVSPDKHIVFDLDEALDIEKKGAPFIQYAHTRACSILRAAEEQNYAVPEHYNGAVLQEPSEIALIKKLAKFDYVVEAAATDLKVHQVAKYARELAELFNLFYKDCPVLTAVDELRNARLVLVDCARIVLRDVLDVLGIEAPAEM
ncbi:MAG TPA: arginine--tRNA ligase [Methanomicrobia archaeon]|nr:arginine--tRNA ligase [Methanomicrobia archaeon]